MTHPQPAGATVGATEGAGGVPVGPEANGARKSPRSTSEQWKFLGREQHWGYVYLVWVRDDGKRFARWVR
jgi:hypothetical protein